MKMTGGRRARKKPKKNDGGIFVGKRRKRSNRYKKTPSDFKREKISEDS